MRQSRPSDTESTFIADRIRAFDRESPERIRWLSSDVVRYGALPLYIGWTETIGVRPDGAIVKWSSEGEYEGCHPVDEIVLVRTALVEGAKRYPPLMGLIPTRPVGARTCEHCGGLGYFPQFPALICDCGGVGWRDGTG